MAKRSRSKSSSSEPLSDSSEVERVNDQVNDEEELEAVGRAGKDSEAEDQDEEEDNDEAAADEEDENEEDDTATNEIAKPEKATLKEMQRLMKHKTQEVLDAQNAAIDAEMNNKGKGLHQTESFAHSDHGRTLKRSQSQPDRADELIGSSSFCGDLNDYYESDDQSNENNNAGEPSIGRKKAKKLLNEECMQFLISMKANQEQVKRMLQQTQNLFQKNYELNLLKAQAAVKKIELKKQREENKILSIDLNSIQDPIRREFFRNYQLKIVAKRANQLR